MSDADVMPFQSPPRGPTADEAKRAVIEAKSALRTHDDHRRVLVEALAAAITDARAQKVPLRELADDLGVSPERIRQMEAGR